MYSQTPFYSKIVTFFVLLLLPTQRKEKHLPQKKKPGFFQGLTLQDFTEKQLSHQSSHKGHKYIPILIFTFFI